MRWKTVIATVASLHIVTLPARADDASRLQAARAVIETTHAADTLRKLLPTFMQQMRKLLSQQGGDQKVIDTFLKDFEQRFDQQTDSFVGLAAQIYAREFSEDDLNGLLAFYRTPTGQHLLDKQVIISQAMIAVGQQWGQMMAKQVLEDFAKRAGAPSKL